MNQRPPNSNWIELQQIAPGQRIARVTLRHSQIIRVQKGRSDGRAGCVVRVRSGSHSHPLMIIERYDTVAALLRLLTSAEDWIEVTEAPSFLLTLVRISTILRLDESDPSFVPAAAALVLDDPQKLDVWILNVADLYASVAARLRGHPVEGTAAAEGTIDGPVAQNAR